MTVAYIISAYRLPHQLVRLVARLQGPGSTTYVHVDLKTPRTTYQEMVNGLAAYDSVRLLPRHACYWGGFGHVRATLEGLERIVDAGTPEYVVVLTGQDYPIRTNASVASYFAAHSGQSFMNYRPLPVAGFPDGGYGRLERRHVVIGARVRALPRGPFLRRVPYGLAPYFGSGYWCLHRSAVEYVVTFLRQHPAYTRFFEHVYIPDEMFFQTILLNSPLKNHIVDDDLHFIKWPGPALLTHADVPDLRTSGDLFARKFQIDRDEDGSVLDRIDRELLALES